MQIETVPSTYLLVAREMDAPRRGCRRPRYFQFSTFEDGRTRLSQTRGTPEARGGYSRTAGSVVERSPAARGPRRC